MALSIPFRNIPLITARAPETQDSYDPGALSGMINRGFLPGSALLEPDVVDGIVDALPIALRCRRHDSLANSDQGHFGRPATPPRDQPDSPGTGRPGP